MARSGAENELIEQFGKFYSESAIPVNQRIEQAVCGCDYGGVSWATRAEIDLVGDMLALGPGDQLMDLGAGSGWPALYLGARFGCDVTLIDLPHEGLVVAAQRARADGLSSASHFVVADGQTLPCKDGAFDAITHSDVLCCLPPKEAVLRECRRVVRAGGQMIFSVIFVDAGLEGAVRTRAIETGPPFVEAETSYEDMLAATGWKLEERLDGTADFLASAKTFFAANAQNADELVMLIGQTEFDARMSREEALTDCLARRHLQRVLYRVVPV